MDRNPKSAYVYQPDSPVGKGSDPAIFAVSGPGTGKYRNLRMTRAAANALVMLIEAQGKTEPCCECGGDYPRVDLLQGEIYCPPCRRREARRLAKKRKKP